MSERVIFEGPSTVNQKLLESAPLGRNVRRLTLRNRPQSYVRHNRVRVFVVPFDSEPLAFLDSQDACDAADEHNENRDLATPEVFPVAMDAVLIDAGEGPAGTRPMIYHVPEDLSRVFAFRCRTVGIDPSRLVAAMMLAHLCNMTPQKTGESIVRALEGWESGRRGFRKWGIAVEAKRSPRPAEEIEIQPLEACGFTPICYSRFRHDEDVLTVAVAVVAVEGGAS